VQTNWGTGGDLQFFVQLDGVATTGDNLLAIFSKAQPMDVSLSYGFPGTAKIVSDQPNELQLLFTVGWNDGSSPWTQLSFDISLQNVEGLTCDMLLLNSFSERC